MPDIDTDLCYRGRGQVIKYLAEKYGEDHVAQIITFGTLAARAVIRDVGRVMGIQLRSGQAGQNGTERSGRYFTKNTGRVQRVF